MAFVPLIFRRGLRHHALPIGALHQARPQETRSTGTTTCLHAVTSGTLDTELSKPQGSHRCTADVAGSICSARVIEVLSRIVSARGTPDYLRPDNRPEFVSHALLAWIRSQGITTALIEPGKPWQNGVAKSFDGKFRDEGLSLEWFRSRAEAKVIIEQGDVITTKYARHSSLGYLTPAEFAAGLKEHAESEQATGRSAEAPHTAAVRPLRHCPRGCG